MRCHLLFHVGLMIVCHQGNPGKRPRNLTPEFQTVRGAVCSRTPVSSLIVQMVGGVPARTWYSTDILSIRDLSFVKHGFVL